MGLRVLCVTPWFPNTPTDGRYNFIYHSVRAVAEAGHEVTVLVTRPWVPHLLAASSPSWSHAYGPLRIEQFDRAISVEMARHLSIPRYVLSEWVDRFYSFVVTARLRRIIRDRNIQVVHAHTEQAGGAAVKAARATGVAAVVTLHGISTAPQVVNSPGKRARLRASLNAAARVILVGEPLRAHFRATTGQDANFRVVPNGFFLHGVTRQESRSVKTTRFVSVANLEEGKGIDLNLEALGRLDSAGCTDWTYAIVGTGAERPALESLVDRLGLREKVIFHGALDHSAAMHTLAAGDVFILPSYREAFGIAYLEAMACGLLAIGVKGQGPEAFIEHGRTGLLVQPTDVGSLYRAVRFAVEQPEEARRIAAAGQRVVCAEFTWSRHAERLSVVYDEARRHIDRADD